MQLCIDAADDVPGVALAVNGLVERTVTWNTERNHSVELLPNIERMLAEAGHMKTDIEAVFVDLGPGGYAALRVGVSIAKGLAHGLGVTIVGVGRLELDAWGAISDRSLKTGRVFAIHRAGRGELAWAAYRREGDAWTEDRPPQITKGALFTAVLASGDLLTGDTDDDVRSMAESRGATISQANTHRVAALAALGNQRLASGRQDDALSMVPLYLRAPAIGPQR
jgi:tRNA threonylcarbamoyladenosine biosynthesis protein TsaB